MSEIDSRMQQLFSAVDTDGSGFIGIDEVRDICAKFGIQGTDADAIFKDLDRDGDGKISYEDFQAGFDDYEKSVLTNNVPNSPGLNRSVDSLENIKKELEMDTRTRQHNSDGLNPVVVERPGPRPRSRGAKSAIQLQLGGNDMPNPDFIQELIEKVNKLKEENQRLAKSWVRVKQEHEQNLHHLEEEMDSQVKEVELRVKQKAKEELEAERKSMRDLMKNDMDELQAHLSMFEKVDSWLKANHSNQQDEKLNEFRTKLEEAVQENRQMRFSLMDTQTTVALMRTDLAQMRTQYENKCKELALERERVMEAIHEQEYLSRQLHVLQDANKRLHDSSDVDIETFTTESLRSDVASNKQTTKYKRGSIVGDYIDPEKSSKLVRHQLEIKECDAAVSDTGSGSAHSHQSFCSAPAITWSRPQPGDEEFDSGLSSNLREEDDCESHHGRHSLQASPSVKGRSSLKPNTTMQRAYSSGCVRNQVDNEQMSSMSTRSYDDSCVDQIENTWAPFVRDATGPPERTYKVIFIGDASVGKSSFIWRVTKNAFVSQLGSTLGVDFQIKTLSVDGSNVALQLWDTAGQERFRSITKSYFRKADGIMLLYDVSNEYSFLNIRQWMTDVEELTSRTVPLMIIGNKTDLRENADAETKALFVSAESGRKIATDHEAEFSETSVKDGTQILIAIGRLVKKMMENEDRLVTNSVVTLVKRDSKLFSCCSK